jgi:hypothetical protein
MNDSVPDIQRQSHPNKRKGYGVRCGKYFVKNEYANKKVDCRRNVLEKTYGIQGYSDGRHAKPVER